MNQRQKHRHGLTWEWADSPINRSIIAAVEDRWGIRFPEDYIECAIVNHGGHPIPDGFDVPGQETTVLNRLLSYRVGSPYHIVAEYEALREALPPKVFPFAEDPAGNYLCFDYREPFDDKPFIVFWDHELASTDQPEKALSYVCRSFTDLLDSLCE